MKRTIIIALLLVSTFADAQPLSQKMAATAMKFWPDSFSVVPGKRARWAYDQGVILKGIEGIWENTGSSDYLNYIEHSMDYYVKEDGTIYDYKQSDYNLDNINNGKMLLLLYEITGKPKYKKAADLLRDQLRGQPRTNEGGFWHKKIYPYQMWLDGLHMAEPFYAEYAQLFHEDTTFNDIAQQFIYMDRHARDPKTGLLYHGWDESKQQKWANQQTGNSPSFWGRAMGWYGIALVDVLDYYPVHSWGRDSLVAILNRFAKAIVKVQDIKSGVWYNVLDKPTGKGNYLESSASSMFVYVLAKGVRKGYLPVSYLANAKKGYAGIIKEFIETDANGQTNLKQTIAASGLGGNPYRDGSYAYYMSEPVVVNDPKGMGAFIQCAVEMEMVPNLSMAKGKTVLLDRYFNSEKRKDLGGQMDYFHYIWPVKSDPGFFMWGNMFQKYGAKLSNLDVAPTAANLKSASVYIIVDPDHIKDNPAPNYVTEKDAQTISNWVKAGGVLVLMANDSANCDLPHFNILANQFGITFTDQSVNMVKNNVYEQGAVITKPKHEIFTSPQKMFLKEISLIKVKAPAYASVSKEGGVVMAVAHFGKGTVFAVGDPWLYDEYTDGRRLPADFTNHEALEELSKWLLRQAKK